MDCVFLHRGVGCWQEGEGSRLRLFDGWVRELSTFSKEICVQHFVTFIKRRFEERTSRKANIPYFCIKGTKWIFQTSTQQTKLVADFLLLNLQYRSDINVQHHVSLRCYGDLSSWAQQWGHGVPIRHTSPDAKPF